MLVFTMLVFPPEIMGAGDRTSVVAFYDDRHLVMNSQRSICAFIKMLRIFQVWKFAHVQDSVGRNMFLMLISLLWNCL